MHNNRQVKNLLCLSRFGPNEQWDKFLFWNNVGNSIMIERIHQKTHSRRFPFSSLHKILFLKHRKNQYWTEIAEGRNRIL